MRQVVKAWLERAGYRVLLASDGAAAKQLYLEHRRTIHMFLIDVEMPKVSGPEFADHVLSHEPTARILFMSGSRWDATRGLGCIDKPFKPAQLVGRIGDALKDAP